MFLEKCKRSKTFSNQGINKKTLFTFLFLIQMYTTYSKTKLKQQEGKCLAKACRDPNPIHIRAETKETIEQLNTNVSYTFKDWDKTSNQQWLQERHVKMVCILSVSLAKPDDSDNKIDDTRRTMLMKAISSWVDHDWAVLLFVPVFNQNQYEDCAKVTKAFDNNVNVVPYEINQGTCNNRMNVGESRNAILHFVRKFNHIMKTCTVADERVECILRPRPVLSNVGVEPSDEPVTIVNQRIKEGYDRLAMVNDFLRLGNAAEDIFIEHQEKSKGFWNSRKKKEQIFKTIVSAHDPENPETSLWHQLNAIEPTLLGLPQEYRWFMRRTPVTDLHGKKRYKRWKLSGQNKFMGADVGPFATTRLTMPTQLITFKVGVGGWGGQVFYPYTTIGEDNFFSYEWVNRGIGPVRQLDCVQIIRKFDNKKVSITRTPDDITKYTDCAIKELMYILNSDTYVQNKAKTMTKLLWVPEADRQSLDQECYKWQAFIFSQICVVAKDRKLEISEKVRWISNRMLKFILSEKFRDPKYFTDRNEQTYNKMIALLKLKHLKYIKKLSLPIPEPRDVYYSSDSEDEEDEEDEDEEDEEDEEDSEQISYDLEDVDLKSLSVNVLRRLCEERDINVGARAHKKTCINALRSWKDTFGIAAIMGEMKINDEWSAPKVGDRVWIKYQRPGEKYCGEIIKIERSHNGLEITLIFDNGEIEVLTPSIFSKKAWQKGNWYYDNE